MERNSTSWFWNRDLDAVVKSDILVPTPITRSALRATRLAARFPVVPMPAKVQHMAGHNRAFPGLGFQQREY